MVNQADNPLFNLCIMRSLLPVLFGGGVMRQRYGVRNNSFPFLSKRSMAIAMPHRWRIGPPEFVARVQH